MSDKEYYKLWREKNPDKIKESRSKHDAKRRREDPLYFVKKIWHERKSQSLRQAIPFEITVEDISAVPKHCPILGVKLVSGGINNPNSPSLDRLIPSKGYVKGNVEWISLRANRIKCDASVEEIELLLKWMKGK